MTSGWTHSRPCSSRGRERRKGDPAPSTWIVEQTSWRRPGTVSSALRNPPPGVSAPSTTNTEPPWRAMVMEAASPFGPDPMPTATRSPPAVTPGKAPTRGPIDRCSPSTGTTAPCPVPVALRRKGTRSGDTHRHSPRTRSSPGASRGDGHRLGLGFGDGRPGREEDGRSRQSGDQRPGEDSHLGDVAHPRVLEGERRHEQGHGEAYARYRAQAHDVGPPRPRRHPADTQPD